MKKAIAIAAIATFAASPAAAGNLRAPASKTLLRRCARDAKVEECCPGTGHKLYHRKDDGNPGRLGKQCCSKSLGAWLPTNGEDADKFCSLGQRTSDAEKSVDEVKSVSDRMANALSALNAEKKDLKAEYRAAYIAHEKTENSKQGEVERDQKELQLMEDRNAQSKAKLNGLKDDVVQEEDKLKKSLQANNEKLEEMDSKIDDAQNKFGVKQKAYAKIVSEINDARKELDTCKFKTKEETDLIAGIRDSIEDVKKRQDAADDENKKYEKKITATEAALVAQKKNAAKEQSEAVMALGNVKKSTRELNKKMVQLQASIDNVENQIIMVDKAIEKQQKVNKKIGVSLMEVWKKEPETETSAFDAKKYAAGKLTKKGDSWVDSEAAMLNDAQSFVKSKMASMQKVLLNLKAVRSRVKALKKLDIELNKEIMDDLQKKHGVLATQIKEANSQATLLANQIFGAGEALRKAQKANRKALELFRKQVTAKTFRLSEVAKNLKEMTRLIFDAKVKTVALFAKNKFCAGKLQGAKIVKVLVERNLDAERKELGDLTATLETNKDKMERFKTELRTEQTAHESEMAAISSETGRLKDEYDNLKDRFNYKVKDRKKKLAEHGDKKAELTKLENKALGGEDDFQEV
jgi:chromosome segregation ATPase